MMRSSRKKCREYEKHWNAKCVDKGLEDIWLERLNALSAFSLIGICEGHTGQRPGSSGRYPHINLRLKAVLLPGIAKYWETLRGTLRNEVGQLFVNGDTDVRLDLKFRLRVGRGKLLYQEDLTMRMRGYEARGTEEMGEDIHAWFEDNIKRIETLDCHVYTWHKENSEI